MRSIVDGRALVASRPSVHSGFLFLSHHKIPNNSESRQVIVNLKGHCASQSM